ncbi:MAG: hypothetical protein ACRBN8_22455 [Nannocystales bacterium]
MTTIVDFADIIPTEDQQQAIIEAHVPKPVFLSLAWAEGVGQGHGPNVRFTGLGLPTVPAGTKAEGAAFAFAGQSMSSHNLAAGYVGFSDNFSRELNYDATLDAFRILVRNALKALVQRGDNDGASLLESATNSTTFGAALTEDDIDDVFAQFVVQNPNSESWGVVLHPFQIRDLNRDIRANGGTYLGGAGASEEIRKQMGYGQGYVGRRGMLDYWVSNNTPITAGNGTGAMLSQGDYGALAFRSWEAMTVEDIYQPGSKNWELTFSARYGWVITDEAEIHAIVAPAAA